MAYETITELEPVMSRITTLVEQYLCNSNIHRPSFRIDTPGAFSVPGDNVEVEAVCQAVVEAPLKLRNLMPGPR